MDFMALANTKAAGELAKGFGEALGGGNAPISSGASLDGRSWIDGSGWAVATGGGKATGGDRDQATDPGTANLASGTAQAGIGSLPVLLLLGLLVAGIMRRGQS